MAANEQDDYEAVLQDFYDTMALKQEGDEGNKLAKAQIWGFLAKLAAPLIADAVSNLIPRGNGEVALEQEDGDDYEARFQEDDDYPNAQLQDLYDSLALNQEEDGDEDGDKEAQMQKFRFSKLGRSFKKFGRKALRIGRRVGKGILKHGVPIAGQIIGGALAGRGGANYPSYGGGYQSEAMEQQGKFG